jgi:hypothetical protein
MVYLGKQRSCRESQEILRHFCPCIIYNTMGEIPRYKLALSLVGKVGRG